jgi:hypothetical protein
MLVKQPLKPGNGLQASEFDESPFSILVATDGAAFTDLREVLRADRRIKPAQIWLREE